MKKVLLAIIGNLLLSGNLLSQNWSNSDIELFIKECITEAESYFTKDGSLEYCSCSAEKVMALYPDVLSVENLTDKEIGIVAFECVSQILETRDDVFLSWDETTKAAFVESCQEELKGTGINADYYRACALEEVMIVYPTPFEAINITPEVIDKIALKCLVE